jgi:hypothetical protein
MAGQGYSSRNSHCGAFIGETVKVVVMRLLERMYRSPLGRVMSEVAQLLARLQKPFMVYGYFDQVSR